MVEESDVIDFLKDRGGQASLNDVALGLGISKYGPNSAYALLQSLKSKGIVDRKGEMWVLTSAEIEKPAAPQPTKPAAAEEAPAPTQNVETLVQAMAKTLAEAMKVSPPPPDQWELATKPMKTEIKKEEEKLSAFVLRPDEAVEAKKPLVGFKTGTFLDQLFITPE